MGGGGGGVNKHIAIMSISHGLQLQLLWCGDCCGVVEYFVAFGCIVVPHFLSMLCVHVGGFEESTSL